METNESDEIVIDLRDLVGHLLSKAWIIILVAVLAAGIGYGYSKFMITPQYTSTSQLYIMGKSQSISEISLSDLQIGSQLTSDYMILVKSRPVMEQVIENLGLDMNYKQLREIMTISNPTGTRILTISIHYPDAYMAKEIVDEISAVACSRISEIMDLEEPNVFENGYVENNPSSPNVKKNTILAGLVGCMLTVGILVVLYLLDDSLNTPEDVERYLGISTLGTIPMMDDEKGTYGKIKSKKQQKNKAK